MRKTRRIDPEVYEAIAELASGAVPFSGPRIYNEIKRRFSVSRTPSVRTIQSVMREVAPPVDVGDRWSLMDADPLDAAVMLPVIADLIRLSNGRLNGVGMPIARHIVRIRRAVPNIPAVDALRMAARYVEAEEGGVSTEHLDAYLALGAWNDDAREEAIRNGWLPIDWWLVRKETRDV